MLLCILGVKQTNFCGYGSFERVQYVTGKVERKTEIRQIQDELRMNEYPRVMITRERKKAMSKRRERDASQLKQTVNGEEKDMKTISIPYIKRTSEAVRRVEGPLGIRTAMRSTKLKWRSYNESKTN